MKCNFLTLAQPRARPAEISLFGVGVIIGQTVPTISRTPSKPVVIMFSSSGSPSLDLPHRVLLLERGQVLLLRGHWRARLQVSLNLSLCLSVHV